MGLSDLLDESCSFALSAGTGSGAVSVAVSELQVPARIKFVQKVTREFNGMPAYQYVYVIFVEF
jgi:hypothetical protein